MELGQGAPAVRPGAEPQERGSETSGARGTCTRQPRHVRFAGLTARRGSAGTPNGRPALGLARAGAKVFEHLTPMRQLSRRERWGRGFEGQRALCPRLVARARALDTSTETAEADRMSRADVVGFVLHDDLLPELPLLKEPENPTSLDLCSAPAVLEHLVFVGPAETPGAWREPQLGATGWNAGRSNRRQRRDRQILEIELMG